MGISLLFAVMGALVASVLSLVPALHIYNVAGFIILATAALEGSVPPELLAFFFLGMITGYAMLNTIPSVFLSAPDDSTLFVVLPGPHQQVVAELSHQHVAVAAAVELVVGGSAAEHVGAAVAVERVVSGDDALGLLLLVAEDGVLVVAAVERIGAPAADEIVVVIVAMEDVVCAATVEGVFPGAAADQVGILFPAEQVVAPAAIERQ